MAALEGELENERLRKLVCRKTLTENIFAENCGKICILHQKPVHEKHQCAGWTM